MNSTKASLVDVADLRRTEWLAIIGRSEMDLTEHLGMAAQADPIRRTQLMGIGDQLGAAHGHLAHTLDVWVFEVAAAVGVELTGPDAAPEPSSADEPVITAEATPT